MSNQSLTMRSAVSAILSEPSEASSMAFPDYAQTSADHRRGLLMILQVGSKLPGSAFARIKDRIFSIRKVSINKDGEASKNFRVRYTNNHPLENNEWGEFQLHRSLIGLICVGGYSSPQELCELSRLHDVAKAKYSKSLIDTRLVAIGLNDATWKNGNHEDDFMNLPELETNQTSLNNGAQTTICFYQSKDYEEALEADICDFVLGLYDILEGKRRDFLKQTNHEKLPFFCAPFEKKDFVGLDLESRTNKKRTYGRFRKHLGDLSLLCDLPNEAWNHYENSVEILRSCNDWIWLAGGLEGLCAISVMTLYPMLNKSTVFATRNSSYDSLSSIKKKISFDEKPLPLAPSKVLRGPDIIEKYKECVVHYSKYRNAGVIETEASIKAVRVLTEQCNYLLAAEFLQNSVFINLQMNDEEKIQRFSALADLYKAIGFKRKSAFFMRVAAMRCVAPQNPHPDWALCYSLLLKATSGYCIQLGNTTLGLKTTFNGWPALQVQLLQEMVGTGRRMGNNAIATRHMTYLLEVMFDHISDTEKSDFSQQLSVLTSRHPGDDKPLTLDGIGGLILPPIPLYKIPKVSSFSLCPLPSHLAPRRKLGHQKNKESVFVFTPLNFGGPENDKKKVNFQWVSHDVAEVCLTLFNPLPIEVKVIGLALLHEGVEFENFPSALSLAPNSGPHSVSLLGVPKQPGELKILGYKLNVLGVQSSCRLRGPKGQTVDYKISVVPSLPQLDCGLRQGDKKIDTDEMLRLYLGETAAFECILTNISNIQADGIKVQVETNPYYLKDMVQVLDDAVNAELEPGDCLAFKFQVKAMKLLVNNTFSVVDDDSIQSVMPTRQESGRWSGRSNDHGSNSSSVKRPTFVTIDVKISYSGGNGGQEGYRRELVKTLKIDICPSALVGKWDILPSEVQHENYLVLDISNQSIHEMELEYGENKKIISIEPTDECRIPVPVPKFPLQSQDSLKSRQMDCLKHLEETLHIKWSLPRLENRHGIVCLREIKLDEQMISSLELCPLEWQLKINAQEVTGAVLNLSLGAEIKLEMSVKSQFNLPIKAKFSVEFLLEETNFPDGMVVISQPESETQDCQPEHLLNHSVVVLPLTSGVYDVICSCSILKNDNQSDYYVSKYPKIKININDV